MRENHGLASTDSTKQPTVFINVFVVSTMRRVARRGGQYRISPYRYSLWTLCLSRDMLVA